MPASFAESLQRRLTHHAAHHLRRELLPVASLVGPRLQTTSRSLIQFASNDDLGLARHPQLIEAARTATLAFGTGSTASRLICGSLAPHHALEAGLAQLKRSPAALTFSSGYATALGTIPALVGAGDTVVLDRLAHASLVDGARLSGAQLRVFRHNDPADLRRVLQSEIQRRQRRQRTETTSPPSDHPPATLVITESVFSMDGDVAPLVDLADAKDEFGAWLMVDEAHATGVLGATRAGWIEALGVGERVEVILGTLGKALGAAGGFVAGSQELHDLLVHDARSFLFSTAPPPAQSAAALAALEILSSQEGAHRHARLWDNVRSLHAGLIALGWELPPASSPILPLPVGDEAEASRVSLALREAGFFVPAIRFPTVPRGRARLRVTVSAEHQPDQIDAFLAALGRVRAAFPPS